MHQATMTVEAQKTPPKPAFFVSFVVGVRNERARLPALLESIRRQRYPAERIEIVVADGGSDDGTIEYARSMGCTVVPNPLVRCEPGIALALSQARGDLAVVLAADNALADENFLSEVTRPFGDERIVAAMPRVVSVPSDCLTTKYINAFTDPFNHFLYGAAAAPSTFDRAFPVLWRGDGYVVHDFSKGDPPLLAFAQGFTVRAPFDRPAGTEEDDIAPATALLAAGAKIAYVPGARIEHHTVGGLGDFLGKFGPRIAARLEDHSAPLWRRSISWSKARRLRAYVWPFYSISFVAPALASLAGYARDRQPMWFAHPFLSFALGCAFWQQLARHALVRGKR